MCYHTVIIKRVKWGDKVMMLKDIMIATIITLMCKHFLTTALLGRQPI